MSSTTPFQMTQIPLEGERFVRLKPPTKSQNWCSTHKYSIILLGFVILFSVHVGFSIYLWTRLSNFESEIGRCKYVLGSVQPIVSNETMEQTTSQVDKMDAQLDSELVDHTQSTTHYQMDGIHQQVISFVGHRNADLKKSLIDTISRTNNITAISIKDKLEQTASNIRTELKELRDQIVPIGFIYIQYGNQSDPTMLWEFYKWIEITWSYAGQFFRAEGPNSKPFNQTQEENSPRVTRVTLQTKTGDQSVELKPGGTSKTVKTAGKDGLWYGLEFSTSGGEVRPYNSAIRIWQRVA